MYKTRPTLEHRKTLGLIRSINPNMFIDQPRQSQTCQLLKIKMLNSPAQNHRTAMPALPCGIFLQCMGRIYFYSFFFTFKRKLWEVVLNHEFWVPRGITCEMMWKNIHYIWFPHSTLTESHWCWKYSLSLYFIKKVFQSICVDRLTDNWKCI